MMSVANVTSHAAPTPIAPNLDEDWPTLDELSLRYLHRVMDRTKGNKTRAAEILGIDRRTVIRILAKVRKGKTPVMQTNGGP
jgi:Fis family transcriptional regulator, factor for inversion stimulation protein